MHTFQWTVCVRTIASLCFCVCRVFTHSCLRFCMCEQISNTKYILFATRISFIVVVVAIIMLLLLLLYLRPVHMVRTQHPATIYTIQHSHSDCTRTTIIYKPWIARNKTKQTIILPLKFIHSSPPFLFCFAVHTILTEMCVLFSSFFISWFILILISMYACEYVCLIMH